VEFKIVNTTWISVPLVGSLLTRLCGLYINLLCDSNRIDPTR